MMYYANSSYLIVHACIETKVHDTYFICDNLHTDKDDIDSVLMNSIGVVVDVSAPKDLLQSFMEEFVPDTQPVVMVAAGAGTNERKLKLAMELLEKCSPAAICGRRPDLVALGEVVLEKYSHSIDQDDSIDEEPSQTRKERSKSAPYLRTRKLRKTRSPSPARKLKVH